MCGRKDYYTDEEFWEQNPYPDHPDNDAYDIGCELQRKRVECAIMIKAAEAENE